MKIAKLKVSFDRGAKQNTAKDLGLTKLPEVTEDGEGLVRGAGTHWVSAADRDRVKACEAEDRRLRGAFAATFIAAPFGGTYIVTSDTEADDLLVKLTPSALVTATVQVYDLHPKGGKMKPDVTAEWAERIKSQIEKVPLTEKGVDRKYATKTSLAVLEKLAQCPVLAADTRDALLALISDAKLDKLERVEFKRKLADVKLDIDLSGAVKPRRAAVGAA